MARPIDADAVKFSISGLRYIDPNDYFALAEYFMKQVKAMPTLTPPNEWVSVEERLPEFPNFLDHIMVIICNKNGYVIPMVRERTLVGYEWVERWLYPWNKIYDGLEITHWMPLPKPPKGGLRNETNRC